MIRDEVLGPEGQRGTQDHALTFRDAPEGFTAACLLCRRAFLDWQDAQQHPCEPAESNAVEMIARCVIGQGLTECGEVSP